MHKCKECEKEFKSKKGLTVHKIQEHNYKTDREKYGVKCEICRKKYLSLKNHIYTHCTLNEYKEKYGEIILSEHSKRNYSEKNKINGKIGSIILCKKLKETKYKEEFGRKVSETIKNSPKAIEVRRQNMINLNNNITDERRKRLSNNMKKKRKNPEFNKKCHEWQKDREKLMEATKNGVEAMKKVDTYISKAERQIKEWLHKSGYKTNTNRFLIEGKNRFYDIRVDKLLIEIDGPWHFEEFYTRFKENNYDPNVDESKNQYAIDNGYILLRVSNWGDKLDDQKAIVKAYLDKIDKLECGVYYEGKRYNAK